VYIHGQGLDNAQAMLNATLKSAAIRWHVLQRVKSHIPQPLDIYLQDLDGQQAFLEVIDVCENIPGWWRLKRHQSRQACNAQQLVSPMKK